MSRKKVVITLMCVLSIGWIFGFYGWYMPSYLEDHKAEQKEVIEMSDMAPVEQVEVSGWSSTATWKVIKHDSTGSPIEKTIDVRLDHGNWLVQPH